MAAPGRSDMAKPDTAATRTAGPLNASMAEADTAATRTAGRLNASMAEAAAEAALQKIADALKQPGTTAKVASLQLLGELGLDAVEREFKDDIILDVANVISVANGEAGDRVKYKAAVAQAARRWELFLAVYGIDREQEPTDEMVQSFVGFMYLYRQRASRTGRQGLGDSVAEMAQYILPQARVPSRSNHTQSNVIK